MSENTFISRSNEIMVTLQYPYQPAPLCCHNLLYIIVNLRVESLTNFFEGEEADLEVLEDDLTCQISACCSYWPDVARILKIFLFL